jgi:hypothetical protein
MTEWMLKLRFKDGEHTEDQWGRHMEEGRREVVVTGFHVPQGILLDIVAVEEAP